MTNYEWWHTRLAQLKDYIQTHNKLPSGKNADEDTKNIAIWMGVQKRNYKIQDDIMKDETIRRDWENFVSMYPNLFRV